MSSEFLKNVTNIDFEIYNVLRRKWARMLEVIEQDIPLLIDSDEDDRLNTVNKIIDEYRKSRL